MGRSAVGKAAESGRRGILSPAPHTTQHAGPHWATKKVSEV